MTSLVMARRDSIVERLFRNAKIESLTDCWIWLGCRDRKGYGRFPLRKPDGGQYFTRAHRVAYELFVGPLDGDQVDHLCEVRACFNPMHLRRCTLLENVYYRNHGREADPLDEELDAVFGVAV